MKKPYLSIIILILLIVSLGVTLAYFTPRIIGNGADIDVTSGSFDLELSNSNLNPVTVFRPIYDSSVATSPYAYNNTFTVKRTASSTLPVCYKVYLVIDDINSSLRSEWFKYKVNDGTTDVIGNFSGSSTKITLYENQYFAADDFSTDSYDISMWISYSDSVDQSDILLAGSSDKTITAHFQVDALSGACQ